MDTVVTPLQEFAKNSARLVKRCTKPDRKGKVALTVTITFLANKEYAIDFTAPIALQSLTRSQRGQRWASWLWAS